MITITLKEFKDGDFKEGFVKCSTNISDTGLLKFESVNQNWWVHSNDLQRSFSCIPDETVYIEEFTNELKRGL